MASNYTPTSWKGMSAESAGRLISAAPMLLATLRDLIIENDDYGGALPSSPAWDIARKTGRAKR